MKMKLYIFGVILLLVSCKENEIVKDDFTGNEAVFALQPGGSYPIDGTVTFKEKVDGTTLIVVAVSGTEGNIQHPVHLHLGNITTPGADVYALLNPVLGKTGKSETVLKQTSDETPVTYTQLINLDACLKIHLSASGPDKNTVLAGGNIGKAARDFTSGRAELMTCESE